MTNRKILHHDAIELIACTEEWEVIRECSNILDRLEEVGDDPTVDGEIEGYRERITVLLNRE